MCNTLDIIRKVFREFPKLHLAAANNSFITALATTTKANDLNKGLFYNIFGNEDTKSKETKYAKRIRKTSLNIFQNLAELYKDMKKGPLTSYGIAKETFERNYSDLKFPPYEDLKFKNMYINHV
eukprot:UN28324